MVYYAGPAKTPAGYASGSFGPTTAGRMDAYQDAFMAAGGNFISLAKGNRWHLLPPAMPADLLVHGVLVKQGVLARALVVDEW